MSCPDVASWVSGVAFAAHSPEPRMTFAEWSEQYRVLSRVGSAEPGPYRLSRTPYWREPLEAMGPSSPVQEIAIRAAAQIGKTELLNNGIGAMIHLAPGPAILVHSTEATSKRNSEQRIEPMITACQPLRARVTMRTREKGSRTLQKMFPGGVLYMCGANSAAPLRSMPARWIFLDEVDNYPDDVDSEGHPCALARARAETFPNRKIVETTTPGISETSRIDRVIALSDDRRYHVPCPLCGASQELRFSQLRWSPRCPETAQYECEHCGESFDEKHKPAILQAGEWVPQGDPAARIRGYSLSALYSPLGWKSWESIAAQWEEAQGDRQSLKVFVNTVLAESWKQTGDAPDHLRLYERFRLPYQRGTCPKGVLALTAGVDVQQDRIELEVLGWGRSLKRTWSVDYITIPGSPLEPETWERLEEVLAREYRTEQGAALTINRACIDTGYQTQDVYRWLEAQNPHRVTGVKGVDSKEIMHAATAVDVDLRGRKLRRGLKVFPVGVSQIKTELYDEFQHQIDGGTVKHSWPEYAEDYFRGVTAESIEPVKRRGYTRRLWVKHYERNEPLDCRCYAIYAALLSGYQRLDAREWDELERRAKANLSSAARDATPKTGGPGSGRPVRPTGRIRGRWG